MNDFHKVYISCATLTTKTVIVSVSCDKFAVNCIIYIISKGICRDSFARDQTEIPFFPVKAEGITGFNRQNPHGCSTAGIGSNLFFYIKQYIDSIGKLCGIGFAFALWDDWGADIKAPPAK